MSLQIFANSDRSTMSRGLVVSATNLTERAALNMIAGDQIVIDLYLTGQSGLQNIQDYPTVRLGIGSLNARPEGGTWDLGSETGIAYDESAAGIETAIESEVNDCSVTQLAPFVFKVKFDTDGAQTIPAVDATGLTPASTVSIQRIVVGDASTREEWLIRLFQNPIALIDSEWSNITGNGIRGALNLGTEGIYDLLGSDTSAQATAELELTDANGDVQTIFQVPVTISGKVIGNGVTGVAAFDSYATNAAFVDSATRSNYVIVSAANGSDTSGLREREDRPFATPSAAIAVATVNDVIIIRDGNFSNDTITIPDSVTIAANPSSIGPNCVSTATNQFILIGQFASLSHAGTGTATLGAVDMNYLNVSGASGSLSIRNSLFAARDIETQSAVEITGGCNVRFDQCRITSDKPGSPAIIVSTFTGAAFLADSEIKAAVATGTSAADAFEIVSTLTGSVQIKDCTLIGTSTGTYLAEAIRADTACTVQVQGSLSSNVEVSATVTFDGGMLHTDSNYDI